MYCSIGAIFKPLNEIFGLFYCRHFNLILIRINISAHSCNKMHVTMA